MIIYNTARDLCYFIYRLYVRYAMPKFIRFLFNLNTKIQKIQADSKLYVYIYIQVDYVDI